LNAINYNSLGSLLSLFEGGLQVGGVQFYGLAS
jgi:hypothetical protein